MWRGHPDLRRPHSPGLVQRRSESPGTRFGVGAAATRCLCAGVATPSREAGALPQGSHLRATRAVSSGLLVGNESRLCLIEDDPLTPARRAKEGAEVFFDAAEPVTCVSLPAANRAVAAGRSAGCEVADPNRHPLSTAVAFGACWESISICPRQITFSEL